jgi:hypothetical protein
MRRWRLGREDGGDRDASRFFFWFFDFLFLIKKITDILESRFLATTKESTVIVTVDLIHKSDKFTRESKLHYNSRTHCHGFYSANTFEIKWICTRYLYPRFWIEVRCRRNKSERCKQPYFRRCLIWFEIKLFHPQSTPDSTSTDNLCGESNLNYKFSYAIFSVDGWRQNYLLRKP